MGSKSGVMTSPKEQREGLQNQARGSSFCLPGGHYSHCPTLLAATRARLSVSQRSEPSVLLKLKTINPFQEEVPDARVQRW